MLVAVQSTAVTVAVSLIVMVAAQTTWIFCFLYTEQIWGWCIYVHVLLLHSYRFGEHPQPHDDSEQIVCTSLQMLCTHLTTIQGVSYALNSGVALGGIGAGSAR